MDCPSAPAIAAQIRLGECRVIAAREGRPGAALFLQLREHELSVLAGTQFVGGVIRTGAVAVARQLAANCRATSAHRLRVADAKPGKEGLCADVFQPEHLLAAKLSVQCPLPVNRGDLRRARVRESLDSLGDFFALALCGIDACLFMNAGLFSKVFRRNDRV